VLRSRTLKNLVLDSAILIIKIVFFESLSKVGFQKTDFVVSSPFGAGNTKIGFIMRIAVLDWVTEI
jgi:hypothetical protein